MSVGFADNLMALNGYRGKGISDAAPVAFRPGMKRLSEAAAAEYLGLTLMALRERRRRGTGPAWYRHMGRIAYDVTELDAFKVAAA